MILELKKREWENERENEWEREREIKEINKKKIIEKLIIFKLYRNFIRFYIKLFD